MIPQILQLGPIPINSFGLMVALAILASIYRLSMSFESSGLNSELAEKYVLTGGIVGLVGARVWYLIEDWSSVSRDLLGAIVSSAGFTFYGGFVVSFCTLYILCRRDKIPFYKFLDAVGPTMALGYAIGRVGCQLSGDGDYGLVTNSILGMSYATGVVPTPAGVLAYPTPLYESTLSLLILAVLLWAERKKDWDRPLKRFGLYLSLISLERFSVEYLRINPKIAFGLSEAQLFAVSFVACGILLIFFGGSLFKEKVVS